MQELHDSLKLVYQLEIIFVENYFHHYDFQSNLRKDSKLLQLHFFFPDFNLLSCKLDHFTFRSYIESFYINIVLKQNKIKIF